jgi:predicted O-methyltransferase YrrM
LRRTSRWKVYCLSYLSKPTSDRLIYRAIFHKKPRRILELGIAQGRRALRMIDACARFAERSDVQYTGMDRFEDRAEIDGPGLPLIAAHRILKQCGARIKLIPGDPLRNLAQAANDLGQFDLLVISPQTELDRLNRIWYFVPRLLNPQSLVLLEQQQAGSAKSIKILCFRDVEQLAAKAVRWKAA